MHFLKKYLIFSEFGFCDFYSNANCDGDGDGGVDEVFV